ncbi:MAG: NAD(P)-binding domain-containing protein, partial [Thermoguttaceae bacterium]
MANMLNVGFIGLGQMASALCSGFLRAQIVDSAHVFGYDVSVEAGQKFSATTSAAVCKTPQDVV